MSGGGRESTSQFGIWCLVTLCLAGSGGASALAADSGYWAGYSLSYDSNINRVPTGALSEWTQSLFGGVAYQERSVDLSARLFAQAERRNYLRNTYNDEKLYTVNGEAIYTISPRLITWTLTDVATQVQKDITTPNTPSNRTNANSLSTGPDFSLRLGPVNTVTIGARYGRFDVDGPGDSQSYSAYARWLHPLSSVTTVSASYDASRVTFRDSSSQDFLRENWYLSCDTRGSFGTMSIAGGTSRVIRETGEDRGRYGQLSLSHPITSGSSVQAALSVQYWDTGSQLVGGATSATQPVGTGFSPPTVTGFTTDTYYSKSGNILYDNRGKSYIFVLRGYVNQVDYREQPLDYHEQGGGIQYTWLFSQTGVRTYADYVKRRYLNFFQEDTGRSFGADLTYNMNRNMRVALGGARLEQQSTAPQNNYVDRRATLSFIYSSGLSIR